MSQPVPPPTGATRTRLPQETTTWLRETIVRDIVLAIIVGLLVGTVSGFIVADRQDSLDEARAQRELAAAEQLADQAIRIENLRFVRSQPDDPGPRRSFNGLDLAGMNLSNQFLTYDDFSDSDFTDSIMDESNAYRAIMRRANLTHSRAERTYFNGVDFRQATLAEGIFQGTNFVEADLQWIDGRGADFTDAHLERAKLAHADLRGAILTGATLDDAGTAGACYDETTLWPAKYTPAATEPLDACGPGNWNSGSREKAFWED